MTAIVLKTTAPILRTAAPACRRSRLPRVLALIGDLSAVLCLLGSSAAFAVYTLSHLA